MAAIAVGGLAKVAATLFAAHTARLADATNENQAADLLIPAFDTDLKTLNQLYVAGKLTAAQTIAYLKQVVGNSETYLLKQVGKTGTAWQSVAANGAPNSLPGPTCDKLCTVGCCVFWNDLRPAVYGVGVNAACGAISAINGKASGAPVGNNPYTSYTPEVYPPSDTAYGNYQRAAYTLLWKAPSKSVATQALTSVTPVGTAAPAAPTTTVSKIATIAASPVAAASVSPLSILTNSTLVTVVTLIGGVLLIVAYLFGSNTVRIK